MFVCATLFSAVAVAGARAGWHDWKRMQRCSLEIDHAGARAVFRYFEFLPLPKDWTPDAPYIVPFDGEIAAHVAYTRYGPACLTLKTTLGTVAILARLEGFETVASLFEGLARKNETRLTQSGAKRPAPPEIPTPWYGWIILAAAITTIAATAWFVLFRKS